MKIKTIFAVSLAALATLASCDKVNGGHQDEGDKNSNAVVIEVNRVSKSGIKNMPASRAEGPNVGKNIELTINGGKLYFASAAGIVYKTVDVVKGGGTTDTQIDITADGPQLIQEIDEFATEAHMICNVANLPTEPKDMSEVLRYIGVETQYDGAGGVAAVAVYGKGTLVPTSERGLYDAEINLNPLAGRIEIDKFTAVTATGGEEIDAYQINGIFMDNIYYQVKPDGTAVAADLRDNTSKEPAPQAPQIYVAGSSAYGANNNGTYYDYNKSGIGNLSAKTYTPKVGSSWAYNVFSVNGEMPKIVIQLSNVKTDNHPETSLRYVTITGFTDAADPSPTPALLPFEAGIIYRIKNLEFDADRLEITPDPEIGFTATVTLTVADWEPVDVEGMH